MTDQPKRKDQEADLAPENRNAEQEDESSQAQTVAEEALGRQSGSPTESEAADGGIEWAHEQDLVEHMRDMESSGRIDMGAYEGEPNHDDNSDKYGKRAKLDDLPGDGS